MVQKMDTPSGPLIEPQLFGKFFSSFFVANQVLH